MIIKRLKLSGSLAISSFLALAVLMMAANPVDNIIYVAVFFGLALVFMISVGYSAVRVQAGTVSHKSKYRVVAASLVLLVLLMFGAARSLSWVDGIILLLIGFGLAFYISRRS